MGINRSSMDEIHISQFAALLRQISKVQKRQVVIAVHERALFEYLSLELSPAFEGDKLITIELSQDGQGNTLAASSTHGWKADKAFAA